MNPQIFREYDIRGVAERDLPTSVVTDIGRAYGTFMKRQGKTSVLVGRDARTSSKRLRDALVEGMTSCGLRVTDVGECPTPVLYFSIQHLQNDGGIMITGSHNPPDQNGLKMCVGIWTISGETIQDLRRLIEHRDFEQGKGTCSTTSTLPTYMAFLQKQFQFKRVLNVVVDAGNGMTSLVAPQLIRAAGCRVTELYCTVDCTFPNHIADPTILDSLQNLIRTVKERKADVGIAYDGDGDRIGAINEKGEIIAGDELLILYSRAILVKKPGAVVIGDVKCSKRLYDDVEHHGGKPIMWKTGHSLIKQKMKEVGAAVGGEMSGHMFFADRYFGFDDAIYASLRLLEILDQSTQPFSQLLADLPKMVSTPEIRTACPDDRKFDIVRHIVDDLKTQYQVNDLDGARVTFPDGWGLVRPSNTQPVLVTRFEAVSQQRLGEIRQLIEGKIKEYSK